MHATTIPLMIVGAGPTGLAAALFLARRGMALRIIDAAAEPCLYSKALAVNPRTLEVLAGSGVDERIRADGAPLSHACLHPEGHHSVAVDLRQAGLPEPLRALPQARTEALLTEALATAGVQVERGVRLEELEPGIAATKLRLVHADGTLELASATLVYGADGAHSRVRQALQLDFPGDTLPEPWLLWDIELETMLDPAAAHIMLRPDGFLFLMQLTQGVWRVIGNGAEPLRQLPAGTRPGSVHWQSSFRIGHRVAARAGVGGIALGGDAAHIHSPIGARGMNLGIEDAYVYAACAADALGGNMARMEDYAVLRHAVHQQVVRRIALLTRLVRGRPEPLRWLRDAAMPRALRFAPARAQMVRTVAGLDHPLRTER